VRLYTASNEEPLRARKLLADWAGEGFLTQTQYQRLKQETVSELRTTNIILRLILFLFTLVGVSAAAATALLSFRYAFDCSASKRKRQRRQLNRLRKRFTPSGTARSAAVPCASSNGSPPHNCCFAHHLN